LVDAIIDDQLPLAMSKIGDLDFETILKGNVRYRISQEVFYEIYRLLIEEIESRVASGDPLFMAKLARHMPSMEPESYSLPAHRVKMLFNPEIRRHLLTDQWRVGAKLRAAKQLAVEAKKGAQPLSLLEIFDELATAVQRFELVSRMRERVHLVSSVMSDDQLHKDYGSVRVYRFTEAVEVVGNAVNATVLFLDLRGFTETSEGLVSERDLTHQVYSVFDPFVEVIARFGGEVDKFLGDGMMVTFGAANTSRHGPLHAVRTAIVLQEKLQDLRERGKTHFTMGISIHYGRVYLAHFIGSAGGQDTTVIGRNVNLAGRLSSGAKQRKKETEGATSPIGQPDLVVSVGRDGTLANEGIAVSRETVLAIEKLVPLTPREDVEELYGEFYDTTLERKILLRYAGDAKFKGVWGSFPVYSVELG
jgi:class 3 adenylate cyclase